MTRHARRPATPRAAGGREGLPGRRQALLVAAGFALAALAGGLWWGRDRLRLRLSPPVLQAVTWPDLASADPADSASLEAARSALATREADEGLPSDALARAYGDVGMRLVAAGYMAAADQALANAEALEPRRADWPYYRGFAAAQERRHADAAPHFRRALRLDEDDAPTRLHLAEALTAIGELDEANAALDPLVEDPAAGAAARMLRGEIALTRDDPLGAVSEWELALEAQPEANQIHERLAEGYRRLGDPGLSEEHLALRGPRRVALDDPRAAAISALQQSVGALMVQGDALMAGGQHAAAAERFRRVHERQPDNLDARLNLGAALLQLGRLDEAEPHLRAVLERRPSDLKTLTNLSQLWRAKGDLRPLIDAQATALVVDPSSATLQLGQAEALQEAEGCGRAADHYLAYLKLKPDDLPSRQRTLLCLAATDRWLQARDVAEEGYRLDPAAPAAADGLARVLAAAPDDAARDGARALEVAAAMATAQPGPSAGEVLAMALAETGRYGEAATHQMAVVDAYRADPRLGPPWLPFLNAHLARYQSGQPARQPWPDHLLKRGP